MNSFLQDEITSHAAAVARHAGADLAQRLDPDRQVGDLLKLDCGEAVVVVHDYLKAKVGGLPLGTFLVASRVAPGSDPDPEKEDTSLILLRVLGPAPLPNVGETDMMRFNAAQRSVASNRRWDDKEATDQFTLNLLRYAGLRCRILGTFLLRQDERSEWSMVFGPDLANFYSGRGMKVYKPDERTLAEIVNFVRPQGDERHPAAGYGIRIGRVRYAASEREGDDTGEVRVDIDPTDLLARRTALFGMSRTGKSNTTKIIAAAVYRLRNREEGVRVGQLILDPNGEYANENAQDAGSIRGVAGTSANTRQGDIVSYGLHPHPNDPNRRIIKLNFLGTEPGDWRNRSDVAQALVGLVQGKEILDALLADQGSQYISAFRALRLDVPEDWNDSTRTRYKRLVSAYRTLLSEHLRLPTSMARATLTGLANAELRTVLSSTPKYAPAGTMFGQPSVHWDEARTAWRLLGQAIKDPTSGYSAFNQNYGASRNGKDWHDTELLTVLTYLDSPGGMRLISRLVESHSPLTTTDYADDVVADLRAGRLVIVDQSTGDPDMNKAAAERLMWRVFNAQKQDFIDPPRGADGNTI